jgi:hypothetical protein
MKPLHLLLTLALMLVLSACSSSPAPVTQDGPPKWTMLPPDDGHIYGVGTAPYNYHGMAAQKQDAMAQAIDMIARQKGVTVDNSLERIKRIDNGIQTQGSMIDYSFQTVEGTKVNAKIKDVYHDRYKDIFYILMIER